MSNRMSEEARRALVEAYQRWQPDSGVTAEQLANDHGVTRSAMYSLLRREGIPLKTGRATSRAVREAPLQDDVSWMMGQLMLNQFVDMKLEIEQLKRENEQLRVQLADELAAHRPGNGGNGTPPGGIKRRG